MVGCGLLVVVTALDLGLAWQFGAAPAYQYLTDVGWGLAWAVCGLWAWRLRPVSRVGPLMVVLGVLALVNAPWGFGLPTDFPFRATITVVGLVGFWLQLAVGAQLFVTFPSGRCGRRGERRLIAVVYCQAIASSVLLLLVFNPDPALCGDRCGVSPVRLVHDPSVGRAIATAVQWSACAMALVILVTLLRRVSTASARQRRGLALPFGAAAVVTTLMLLNFGYAAALGTGGTSRILVDTAMYVALLAVPLAFLLGLLRERLAFAGVGELVRQLGHVGPDQVQPGLARVLGDPSLRVLFPVEGGGSLVDVDGRPARVPVGDPAVTVTVLGDEAKPLAVLVHDPDLAEHRELLEASGAAVRLALENARLQAEVRAQLVEVRASRARLVDVADAERRRLERDLHDGAQQRLLGMGMTLGTLRGRMLAADPGSERLIDEATAELRSALRELRDLAEGIHPAVLTDEGLMAALRMLARRCRLPVSIEGELADRPPAAVEAGAYYVASEALQNAVKHSWCEPGGHPDPLPGTARCCWR